MKQQSNRYLLLFFILAILLIPQFGTAKDESGQSQNQKQSVRLADSLQGPDIFHTHCAACHGADGRGNGPAAPALKTSPPDLTTIAKKNGGAFPAERVRGIIAGDQALISHGSREMPIWGEIFHQIENDRDYGHVRMQNIIEYLKSIQQK